MIIIILTEIKCIYLHYRLCVYICIYCVWLYACLYSIICIGRTLQLLWSVFKIIIFYLYKTWWFNQRRLRISTLPQCFVISRYVSCGRYSLLSVSASSECELSACVKLIAQCYQPWERLSTINQLHLDCKYKVSNYSICICDLNLRQPLSCLFIINYLSLYYSEYLPDAVVLIIVHICLKPNICNAHILKYSIKIEAV